MTTVLLIAAGAAVGAPLRYLADKALRSRSGFPLGTLAANVTGSFLLGFLLGLPVSPTLAAVLGTGFCGALTTYSTFSWETLTLARSDRPHRALVYALASIVAGLTAALLGRLLAHMGA
ncbi:putative fluoride ion transporter CrcB 2 [Paractinoplanes deccanensis]|uniref:Fluoride-specific ion channel FluC n=1 Tax=Paractinoplanes deccanensis TaxID=113561 RepID=A0ABQ3YJ78_9ACTN|nr:fluoride efflux transporter CrcB [Actinoplanes deccanensis]GID80054.1 putative fluoride ion transporter CrcB 2 [Actinoplanes deccanensis]